MKNLFALFFASLFAVSGYSIGISSNPNPKPTVTASELLIQIGEGKVISMQELADMSLRDFQKLSNRKMNLADKITFRIGQKKLRENIRPDGTFKNEQIARNYDEGRGFHVGGFALGFLLGLIGVLIAYLIKDEKRGRRRTWAWVGWAVFLAIYIPLILL